MKLQFKRDIVAFSFLIFVFFCVFAILFFSSFRLSLDKKLKIIYISAEKPEQVKLVHCEKVAPIVYSKVPSLRNVPIKVRKRLFISIVLPSILIENFRIKRLRSKLVYLRKKMEKGDLSDKEIMFLKKLCRNYKASTIDDLLFKIDVIPVGLALAQAAIESGWGSSRFFSEANNVFGRWLFGRGRGVKARNSHVVLKKFPTILDSVRDYFYNLNAGWAYEGFRMARRRTKSSLLLVEYLEKYSILGKEYISRVKSIIEKNKLDTYDDCKIASRYIKLSVSIERR